MHEKNLLNVVVLFKNSVSASHLHLGFASQEAVCVECESASDMAEKINDSTGAVVVDKDALDTQGVAKLGEVLSKQPKWSFLPVIMILSPGDLKDPRILEIIKPVPNLTILEQPVLHEVLQSVIKAALAERRRQYELRDSLNEAIEANRAKSDFLANMSHEIRTPLGVVLGFSELLATPELSREERETYFEIVQRNGQLLSALINDVLDLAKVEAGRLKIEFIETSLSELLSDVVSSLKVRLKNKDVKLLIERSEGLSDIIRTDPIRLKQILMNLIGNAIKFTERGYVKIDVSSSSLSERTENRDIVYFRVIDTGIGLKPEQASLLFQTFSQADASITRKFGGTGLGLVLAQKLARAMGGDIKLIESKYGEGSIFEVSIATESIREKKEIVNFQPQQLSSNIDLSGMKILVVDDSKDNQLLIETFLSRANATTFIAENGEEGVEKTLELSPDLVLMDVQMPMLSGIDATAKLRAEGFKKPIIALTAHALKGDREQCLSAGFTDYLTKPINRRELFGCLEKLSEDCKLQSQ